MEMGLLLFIFYFGAFYRLALDTFHTCLENTYIYTQIKIYMSENGCCSLKEAWVGIIYVFIFIYQEVFQLL